jgi:hypothetical protein
MYGVGTPGIQMTFFIHDNAGFSRRCACVALVFGLACLSGGCKGRKQVFPVRGKVFFQGKPPVNAIVFFHPVDDADADMRRPHGVVGADGSFELTTYTANDGAAPGRYSVTVVWKSPSKIGDSQEANLLPLKYMSPETSQLSAVVNEGSTELEPFKLTNEPTRP